MSFWNRFETHMYESEKGDYERERIESQYCKVVIDNKLILKYY